MSRNIQILIQLRAPAFLCGQACALLLALFLCHTAHAAGWLMWFEGGRPTEQARQAVEILEAASVEGLNPTNYAASSLRLALDAAAEGPVIPAAALAQLDRELTSAMERYLSDLHFGRVDPHLISENFSAPPSRDFEPARVLKNAVKAKRLPEAVAAATPPLQLYRDLRDALAHYRELAAETAQTPLWKENPPIQPDMKVEIGQDYAGIPLIAQRLMALGDLPYDTFISNQYTGDIAEGVMAFQERHGLAPDGVIGRRTLAALNVSPSARARQIELTMERLRWTPLLKAPRMVVVNVPDNFLEAYEVREGNIEMKTRMRVITGNAPDTQTPIFDQEMRFVEFNPFWNVPSTIARKELVPEIRKTPDLFARQGFEFVSGDGSVQTELSGDALDAVMRGEKRLRQRPGPKNAMGDIKFVMPNKDNIYLHHTASPGLFERFRRNLSHGCVRVEDPIELAKFVLLNDPAWSEERILKIMTDGNSTTVQLRNPVRVVIAYKTVRVKKDGAVHFFSDVYGQDRMLDKALRGSSFN